MKKNDHQHETQPEHERGLERRPALEGASVEGEGEPDGRDRIGADGEQLRQARESERPPARPRERGSEETLGFERRGERVTATVRLAADDRQEIVPVEDAGQALTAEQKRTRDAWLGSRVR